MTTEERIDILEKKAKKLEFMATVHTLALIFGTLGITAILVEGVKKAIK